jgi:hypothetical protein
MSTITKPVSHITAPKRRAKRGTKEAALSAARKVGLKTFVWKCPHHGETLHGTSGSGQCRMCVAGFKKRYIWRTKAQIAREEAALTPEERETIAKAEAFIASMLSDQ